MRPLEGIRVLDLTRLLPGAVATLALANFGADVIKIEQPGTGDPARHIPGGQALFAETNSGKKSVAIDLKDSRGHQLFNQLVARADVVVESFRPSVMARLNLDYPQLAAINPRLIFASLTGYGRDGEHADTAGHDINYQAMSGLLDLVTRLDGCPTLPDIQLADLAGGSMQVLIGILLALHARHRTGRGQRVDVCMVSGVSHLLAVPLAALRGEKRQTSRGNELLSGKYACYNLYRTLDGPWIAVGALEPEFWATLCHRLGREDLISDQFSPDPRQCEVKRLLSQIFATRPACEWIEILGKDDCCVTPVRQLHEALQDGYFDPAQSVPILSDTPAHSGAMPVPKLGEHSFEILNELGIPEGDLSVLQSAGVIQCFAGESAGREHIPAGDFL